MLTHLSIVNFTIVEEMNIDFTTGLTVITGETGAGKSIAMDALTFTLGAKLDASAIRHGAEQCVITASFLLDESHPAIDLLREWGLDNEEHEYVFSRTLNGQGRTQARLNGSLLSQPQLKSIGGLLVDIHGQHAHQRLLKSDMQREVLDAFAHADQTFEAFRRSYLSHKELKKTIQRLESEQLQQQQKRDLLTYQLAELNDLSPAEDEWETLNQRHTILSNAEGILTDHQNIQYLLNDAEDGNVLSYLEKVTRLTSGLSERQSDIIPIHEAMMGLLDQCREHQRDLARAADRVEMDPQALQEVTDRVTLYTRLAKKHHTTPNDLYHHWQDLQKQLDALNSMDTELEKAYQKLPEQEKALTSAAAALSALRQKAAKTLEHDVARDLKPLNMPHATLNIHLTPLENIGEYGAESIQFLFSANPGQSPAPLGDVASGGELSRLSLVLQVAINGQKGASTLVFDEVDTGISGPTASVVGKLLRRLGQSTQIISITHLPQVAACANNHFVVSKTYSEGTTHSSMQCLTGEDRLHEVARLLGAHSLTAAAVANAKELLDMSLVA